ncbi:unknown [Clostridium sp. CAG:448]|nr:unknown [Clostridium sp. CAG:448]
MNPQKNAENVQVVHDGEKEGEESRRILADMFLFVGGSKTEIIADRTVYRHDAGDKSFVSLSRMQKRECAFLSSYLCMQDNKPGICRADRQAVFLSNAAMSTTGLCLGILVPVRTASFPEIISAVSQSSYQSVQLSSAARHGFRMPAMPPSEDSHVKLVNDIFSFLYTYADTDFAYRPDIRGSLSATAYLRKDLVRIAEFVDVLLVDRSDIPTGTRILTRDVYQMRSIDFSLLKVFSTALMMYLRDRLKNKTLEMNLSVQDGLLVATFSGTLLRGEPVCVPEKERFFRYFSEVTDRLTAQLSVNVNYRHLTVTLVPYRYNPTSAGELHADLTEVLFLNDLHTEE